MKRNADGTQKFWQAAVVDLDNLPGWSCLMRHWGRDSTQGQVRIDFRSAQECVDLLEAKWQEKTTGGDSYDVVATCSARSSNFFQRCQKKAVESVTMGLHERRLGVTDNTRWCEPHERGYPMTEHERAAKFGRNGLAFARHQTDVLAEAKRMRDGRFGEAIRLDENGCVVYNVIDPPRSSNGDEFVWLPALKVVNSEGQAVGFVQLKGIIMLNDLVFPSGVPQEVKNLSRIFRPTGWCGLIPSDLKNTGTGTGVPPLRQRSNAFLASILRIGSTVSGSHVWPRQHGGPGGATFFSTQQCNGVDYRQVIELPFDRLRWQLQPGTMLRLQGELFFDPTISRESPWCLVHTHVHVRHRLINGTPDLLHHFPFEVTVAHTGAQTMTAQQSRAAGRVHLTEEAAKEIAARKRAAQKANAKTVYIERCQDAKTTAEEVTEAVRQGESMAQVRAIIGCSPAPAAVCQEMAKSEYGHSDAILTSLFGSETVAQYRCSFQDCTATVQSRGLCCRHGGGSRKQCSFQDCTTTAHVRGLCRRHAKKQEKKVFTPADFKKFL